MKAKKKKAKKAKKKALAKPQYDHPGQPEKYRPEYCQQLIDHMAQGGSFESFGAVVDVNRYTLYNWAERHAEFFDAKTKGESRALKFYEDAGKAIMTGSLRRLAEENVVRDKDGNVAMGADGRPLLDRRYAHVRGDSKVWGLTMRNRFRWKERVEVTQAGAFKEFSEMTDEELDEELRRLRKLEKEMGT